MESFHNLIEEEFFISEKPNNETELLAKTFSYQIWFNSYRTNRGRDNKNPEQIYQTELNTDKAIPLIPPIVVDNYIPLMGKKVRGGILFAFTTQVRKNLILTTYPFIIICKIRKIVRGVWRNG